MDIVHDKEFKSANHTIDGMLKSMTRSGASRPTNHKSVITSEDMKKISSYFRAAAYSPIVLRQCVWFNLSVQFVSRGLEFQNSTISFKEILLNSVMMTRALSMLFFDMKLNKRISKEASTVRKPLLTSDFMLFLSLHHALLKCFAS